MGVLQEVLVRVARVAGHKAGKFIIHFYNPQF
jgi:hypothetical protein